MKKIIFYRNDDFWGRGINIKIYLDNKCYDLPNNSKIEVESPNLDSSIQAKYLWYSSKKVVLNSSDKILKIRVKQIFSNSQLIISFFAIAISFILYQLYSEDIFKYLFFGIGISFLMYMFFFLTFGSRNYFTFSINE
jgi:hypothetical protein